MSSPVAIGRDGSRRPTEREWVPEAPVALEFNGLAYAVMMATLFAFEFVAISALTEINVGTALRHRSLLLIPILVIWLARKKTDIKQIN